MKQSELNSRTVHAAIGAGIAQVFKDLSNPHSYNPAFGTK